MAAVVLVSFPGGAAAQLTATIPTASPAVTPEQIREDLTELRSALDEREKSWKPGVKGAALRRIDALAAAADTLQWAYLELEIARIVALADNGHTGTAAGARSTHFDRIPLRLAPFPGGFHVLRAPNDHRDLLGARLVAVSGVPVDRLRDAGRALTGGTAGWRDRFVPFFVESPGQMRTLHLIGGTTGATTYRFALLNGREVDRSIIPDPPDPARSTAFSLRWFYPQPNVPELTSWISVLAPDSAPWALRDFGAPFRWRAAPELDAMVIELRATRDQPSAPIRPFLDSMAAAITRRHPTNLVLDLRMNGGGDLNTTRDFAKRLPALVPGRIFLLTSPFTFSAAISTSGYLKQSAPARVTIVGEEAGDRLVFWSEGRGLQLRHTGIGMGLARERHDYQNGCRDFTDCHGPVVRNPISVPTLAPDVSAAWTIEAYRAGRDPGMEAVARELGVKTGSAIPRDGR